MNKYVASIYWGLKIKRYERDRRNEKSPESAYVTAGVRLNGMFARMKKKRRLKLT